MKNIFILLIIIINCNSFSQTKSTYFLTSSFAFKSDTTTKFKRIYEFSSDTIYFTDYLDKKIKQKGYYLGPTDIELAEKYIRYCISSHYSECEEKENKSALITFYSTDEKKTIQKLFLGEKIYTIQRWFNNKPVLTNGSGKYFYKNEKYTQIENYKDSIAVESYNIRHAENDTIYNNTETLAKPTQGFQEFYKDLSNTIDFPKLAKLLNIEKKVYIEFTCEKDGSLSNFKVLNKKSYHFEKNVLNKLENSKKWIPATHNGKPVRTCFILPFVFNIE